MKNLKIGFLNRMARKASTPQTAWTGAEVCAAIVRYCKDAACKSATGAVTISSDKEDKLEALFFQIGQYTVTEQGTGNPTASTSPAVSSSPSGGGQGLLGVVGSAPRHGYMCT